MLNFIVSGYVPGTNFQLSFYSVLIFLAGLFTVLISIYALRTHSIKRLAEQVLLKLISL